MNEELREIGRTLEEQNSLLRELLKNARLIATCAIYTAFAVIGSSDSLPSAASSPAGVVRTSSGEMRFTVHLPH